MNLSIYLPADVESVLRRRAAAKGTDLETFVGQIVKEIAIDDDLSSRKKPSSSEFARRLDAWIALHPVLDHSVEDSRESFYAGREE